MDQEFNITHEDMTGEISVKWANQQTLQDFCLAHLPDFNPDRLEALAIRLYVGAETVITLYAVDKHRQENSNQANDKIPVKKFKLTDVPLAEVFTYCQGFNCTLSTGNYPLHLMEVTNK